MQLVLAGHTTMPTELSWLRGELERVLFKLQPEVCHVAVDTGCAYELAEAALLDDRRVRLHLLVPMLRWERYVSGYPGLPERTRAISRHPNTLSAHHTYGESVNRAVRRSRFTALADTGWPHLLVYDGRDRGSMLDQLQLLMGSHELYIVDPVTKVTRYMRPEVSS